MADEYKKPYLILFNGITDTLECIRQGKWIEAELHLKQVQEEAERVYIDEPEEKE